MIRKAVYTVLYPLWVLLCAIPALAFVLTIGIRIWTIIDNPPRQETCAEVYERIVGGYDLYDRWRGINQGYLKDYCIEHYWKFYRHRHKP